MSAIPTTSRAPSRRPGLAGGKVAKLDRIEWVWIPDSQTQINALLSGEVDMIEAPSHDLLPVLEKDKNVEIVVPDTLGSTYVLRFNWKQPPFNDVRYRRAAALALNQKDFLQAVIGDPRYYKVCKAMFGCGTPLETSAGMDGVLESNFEASKKLLKELGYDGTPIVAAAIDRPRRAHQPRAGRQDPARARRLQGRHAVDGLADAGRAGAPRRTRSPRAAGTSP